MTRSLPSALGQWYDNIEVVVVVDGPDPETERALGVLAEQDARVRPVFLAHNAGGADARNAGIRAARGEWIALLDDDDEWLPDKLETQLRLGQRSSSPLPIVTCAWTTRTNEDETENRPRPMAEGEAFGDYLLRRPSLSERNYSLPSSTLLARTELFRRVPFTSGLFKHQDTDWLLWASEQPGVRLEVAPSVQMVYYRETGRFQMSLEQDWRRSVAWLQAHRNGGRLSNAACASFLVSYLSPLAALTANPATFFQMLGALLLFFPRPFEVLRFLAIWFVTPSVRRHLLALSRRSRSPSPPASPNAPRLRAPEPPPYHSTQGPSSK